MQLAIAICWGLFAIILHVVGEYKNWYFKYTHFDWLTHAISGGGLLFLLMVLLSPALYIVWIIFVVLLILWETVEYLYKDPEDFWHSPRDMATDMLLSTLAAVVVFVAIVLI